MKDWGEMNSKEKETLIFCEEFCDKEIIQDSRDPFDLLEEILE